MKARFPACLIEASAVRYADEKPEALTFQNLSGNRPMPRLVELNHIIEAGMVTYKGVPGPVICDYLAREASRGLYAEGTEFQIGRIDMVANTGTYLDTPFHRYADGADLAELPLALVSALPGWWCATKAPPSGRTPLPGAM
jgi:hypothetical protein